MMTKSDNANTSDQTCYSFMMNFYDYMMDENNYKKDGSYTTFWSYYFLVAGDHWIHNADNLIDLYGIKIPIDIIFKPQMCYFYIPKLFYDILRPFFEDLPNIIHESYKEFREQGHDCLWNFGIFGFFFILINFLFRLYVSLLAAACIVAVMVIGIALETCRVITGVIGGALFTGIHVFVRDILIPTLGSLARLIDSLERFMSPKTGPEEKFVEMIDIPKNTL